MSERGPLEIVTDQIKDCLHRYHDKSPEDGARAILEELADAVNDYIGRHAPYEAEDWGPTEDMAFQVEEWLRAQAQESER